MLHFLGTWLLRSWLMLLVLPLLVRSAVLATIEQLMGWTREPWKTRWLDLLLTRESVALPSLLASFRKFEGGSDGPGFSEQQLPRLWGTCRALAEKLGCPPPDAIHLSVEPGDCMAWNSRVEGGVLRRHVMLSLLDLRLTTLDEGRAIIAHEIAHAGFNHVPRSYEQHYAVGIMDHVLEELPFPLTVPVHLSRATSRLGLRLGAHDDEREADRRSAQVVGGNHVASALKRLYAQGPVVSRVFNLVLTRALAGPRAPRRLAEAAVNLYRSFDFARMSERANERALIAGPEHPALPDRVASAERESSRAGIGSAPFIDAYPELVAAEELLTRTYFPDTPVHARADASQLRRKVLAARLKKR